MTSPAISSPAPLIAKSAAPQAAEAERYVIRAHFSAPVFGKETHDWAFVGTGAHAEALAQAVMQKKPVKLDFPGNTVVLDGAAIALVDFQPYVEEA